MSIGQYRDDASACLYGSIVPVSTNVSPTGDYILGQISNSASTSSSLFKTQVGLTDAVYWDRWTTGNNAIPSLFQYVRPVSIMVCCDYLGATLNAKGKLTAGFAPKNQWRSRGPVAVDDIFRFPGSTQEAVNKLRGASVLYKPLDYSSFNYTDMDGKYDLGTTLTTQPTYGGLFIAVDGATPADSVVFTIIGNYEAVPRTNQVNLVGVASAISDPIALAHAMNEVQRYPAAIPASVFTTPPIGSSAMAPMSTGSFTAPVSTGFTNTSTKSARDRSLLCLTLY